MFQITNQIQFVPFCPNMSSLLDNYERGVATQMPDPRSHRPPDRTDSRNTSARVPDGDPNMHVLA